MNLGLQPWPLPSLHPSRLFSVRTIELNCPWNPDALASASISLKTNTGISALIFSVFVLCLILVLLYQNDWCGFNCFLRWVLVHPTDRCSLLHSLAWCVLTNLWNEVGYVFPSNTSCCDCIITKHFKVTVAMLKILANHWERCGGLKSLAPGYGQLVRWDTHLPTNNTKSQGLASWVGLTWVFWKELWGGPSS